MTTAPLNAKTSVTAKTRHTQQKNGFSASKKPLLVRAVSGFWWHTKAYERVLGIVLLVLGSLVFLSVRSLYSKLAQVLEIITSPIEKIFSSNVVAGQVDRCPKIFPIQR
jgi:hypothetical protein